MTELILIPCSGRKKRGGTRENPGSALSRLLDGEAWEGLCRARVELAEIKELDLSSDLDGTGGQSCVDLLPAFERYDGNLYRKAQLTETQLTGHRRLLIVSALYGLLDARDPIRKYKLKMSDKLPGRITVKRWWREHNLRDVVVNAVERLGAAQVHDVLSGNYRDALRGLPQHLPAGCWYRPYDFPGLGTGSDYHRGDVVRGLLNGFSDPVERPVNTSKPSIDVVWERLKRFQGEEFRTKRGLPFTYEISGNVFHPSRTEFNISKGEFQKALALVPFDGSSVINETVRGPSYVWAVLHDPRIRMQDW